MNPARWGCVDTRCVRDASSRCVEGFVCFDYFHFALVGADDIVRSLDWLSIGLKMCVLRLMMVSVRVSFLVSSSALFARCFGGECRRALVQSTALEKLAGNVESFDEPVDVGNSEVEILRQGVEITDAKIR